jgi:hypothetical protein
MRIGQFLRPMVRWFGRRPISTAHTSALPFRPELEGLEDRLTPTVTLDTSAVGVPIFLGGNQNAANPIKFFISQPPLTGSSGPGALGWTPLISVGQLQAPNAGLLLGVGVPGSDRVVTLADFMSSPNDAELFTAQDAFVSLSGVIAIDVQSGYVATSSVVSGLNGGSGQAGAVTTFVRLHDAFAVSHSGVSTPTEADETARAALGALGQEFIPVVALSPLYGENVAEGTSLPGSDLILVATLLGGGLRDHAADAPAEVKPSDDLFGLFRPPASLLGTAERSGASDAGPTSGVPTANLSPDDPGGTSWQAFRLGVGETLRGSLEGDRVAAAAGTTAGPVVDGDQSGDGPKGEGALAGEAEEQQSDEQDSRTGEEHSDQDRVSTPEDTAGALSTGEDLLGPEAVEAAAAFSAAAPLHVSADGRRSP